MGKWVFNPFTVNLDYSEAGTGGGVDFEAGTPDGAILKKKDATTMEEVTAIPESLIVSNHVLSTFTNTASTQEFGATLNNFTLNWTYNRNGDDPSSQLIDNGIGALLVNLRTYAVSGAGLTASNTYQIDAVGDDSTVSNKSTTVNFRWKRYWGVSTGDVITGANVMSVLEPQGDEFATSRTASKSFTSGGTATYYYYAYPASFGAVSAWTFNGFDQDVANLEYSDGATGYGSSPTNVSLTNSSGGTANYYIVRSVYSYLNTTDVVAIS